MNKTETKEKIKILINKYENSKKANRLNSYTEEETKKDFILPLFEILGWDIYDKNEVSAEESMSSGRVDYGFYLNNRIKFYLEAKKLSADLHNEDFANQTIRYSWNKGATWAILTDFEGIKVFNAQDIKRSLADKLYFEIPYTEYLSRFDQLLLLSRESFQNDLLDKDAEAHGKKFLRIPVTALLYGDLERCRDVLTEKLGQMNESVDPDLLDEGVQKLLDRLIFIRVAEDRGVEDRILVPLVREARFGNGNGKLYESMVKKFREFDNFYNSNLFSPHPFEQWEEYSGTTEKVIDILYGKPGYYEYDFKAMPADVLGAVYESYLGRRLSKSKKGLTVAKDAGKRKEHGIYYTPSFIVDYIVENALGPILNKCHSVTDLKKIKILDPACGSGSFLIKVLGMINDKYKKFGAPGNVYTKIQILTENIYGVDIDPQAVEITKLNLLINALEKRDKLPFLDHIKNGNSLLMNWKEEFPEVFKLGGFDVIIGNPPYVTSKYGKINDSLKKFYIDNFESAYDKLDLYVLFIEKAIKISKDNGFIAFITPWNFLTNFYSFKIRKFLLDNVKIKLLNKLSPNAFNGVIVDNIIFVFEKAKNNKGNSILIDNFFDKDNKKYINQDVYLQNNKYVFDISKDNIAEQILNKMRHNSIELGEIALNYIGIMTGGQNEMIAKKSIFKNSKPVLSGRDIVRWAYFNRGNFVNFDKSKIHSNDNESVYLSKKKILLRKTGRELVACLDKNQFYTIQSLYNIVVKNKDYSEEYLLFLLNSKLFNYIYNKFYITNPEVFPYIKRRHLDQLPIKKISRTEQKLYIKLVEKIISLNKDLQKSSENSEKWNFVKAEIKKIDKKINAEVYRLYGLTRKEIKIIEEQLLSEKV